MSAGTGSARDWRTSADRLAYRVGLGQLNARQEPSKRTYDETQEKSERAECDLASGDNQSEPRIHAP